LYILPLSGHSLIAAELRKLIHSNGDPLKGPVVNKKYCNKAIKGAI